MKSLKITLVAIFSIVLLTGVSASTSKHSNKSSNKEVKKIHKDITSIMDRKITYVPTQG